MLTFYMVCGPSGSGKSTLARHICQEHTDTICISTDGIREELFGDENIQRNGDKVFKIAYECIIDNLREGLNVVFDATNLYAKDRRKILNIAKAAGAACTVCYAFRGNCETCMVHQKSRIRQVPREVVERQCAKYQLPSENEGWDMVVPFYDNLIFL